MTPQRMTAHTFDWQAEGETFLRWMLVTLLPGGVRKEKIEELSAATAGFTNVTLTIQINGIDVPVKNFIDGIERNMKYFSEAEARRIVAELPRFTALNEVVARSQEKLKTVLVDELSAAGIEFNEDDWDD